MENKYIGVKHGGQGRFESTNLGIIFTRQKDGTYISSEDKSFILSEADIKHDLAKGYLESLSSVNINDLINNNTLGLKPSIITNLILNGK